MTKIRAIEPDSEAYDMINGSLQTTRRRRHASTPLYNDVATAYNQLEVEGFLLIDDLNHKRISNLEKVLTNRGLVRYTDYDLYRPSIDNSGNPIPKDQRKTLIKRLTEALMRVV